MKIILRLAGFVKKHWWMLVLAFFSLIAYTGFSLLIPWILGRGIDVVLETGQHSFLLIVGLVVITSSALRGAFGYSEAYLSQAVSQRVSYDIRNSIYDRLQRMSFAFYDRAQTGQLMSRATVDVEAIRMFFGFGLLGIAQTLALLVGISVLLFAMNWPLALFTLAFMPVITWRVFIVSRFLQPVWLKIQEMVAVLGAVLQESLAGIRIVKGFSQEREESRKFEDQAKLLYNEQIFAARVMAFNVSIMMSFMILPTVFILWYGGRLVIEGNLTIGVLTQFILYTGMLLMPVRRLGFMANMLSRTVSAGERIIEILDAEPEVKDKPDALVLGDVQGAVSFKDVNFSYNSPGPVLKNISFEVEPGQSVALLGDSGSGKSTIASLLSRFYDVDSGSITIDGIDIREMSIASLRKNVVTALQDIFLFSSSIRENIAYGNVSAGMEQIVEASKAALLHDFILSLPDGYDTRVGERGLTLSGGEKQRLAIARTLLLNPRVLILDDSTSSVDVETEHLIRGAIDRLIMERTTFIITHRLPIIKNADLILLLKDGEIVERGKHHELMEKNGLYRKLYDSQGVNL